MRSRLLLRLRPGGIAGLGRRELVSAALLGRSPALRAAADGAAPRRAGVEHRLHEAVPADRGGGGEAAGQVVVAAVEEGAVGGVEGAEPPAAAEEPVACGPAREPASFLRQVEIYAPASIILDHSMVPIGN